MAQEIPEGRRKLGESIASLPREHGFEPLRVEGEVPEGLRGTLVRNGPGVFDSFGREYEHWFDGDGVISACRFTASGVEGAARVTQTPELREERAAGRMLYGSGFTRGPLWSKRILGRGKNPTNIHALSWRGRLFAMAEMGLPVELNPSDLQSLPPCRFDGLIKQTLNAHSRLDPATKTTYLTGLTMGLSSALDIYELPAAGAPRLLTSVTLKGVTVMVHDFAITATYLVFLIHPVKVALWPVLLGTRAAAEAVRWAPEEGTEVILVRRDDASVTRFTTKAFFHFHYANAFDRDGVVVVDLCPYLTYEASDAFRLTSLRSGAGLAQVSPALFERAIIDPRAKTFSLKVLIHEACDFPSTSPAVQGRPYRYAFPVVTRGHHDYVAMFDLHEQRVELAALSADIVPGEVTFVPKPNASSEDDGWLLSMAYHLEQRVSGVLVFDARRLSEGTLARAWFDHHVPMPLHGIWL